MLTLQPGHFRSAQREMIRARAATFFDDDDTDGAPAPTWIMGIPYTGTAVRTSSTVLAVLILRFPLAPTAVLLYLGLSPCGILGAPLHTFLISVVYVVPGTAMRSSVLIPEGDYLLCDYR